MATGGRKTHLPHIHQISQRFSSGSAASGVLGVIPDGAVLLSAHISVSQAFNSTTNTLALGTTPGGVNIMAATDLKTLARTDTPVVVAQQGPWVGDTPVYWTLAGTGAAPSQGAAVAFLDYIANIG
jgi:hypothetical protein